MSSLLRPSSLVWALALTACDSASSDAGYEEGEERSGGAATVFNTSQDAYTKSAKGLDFDQEGTFQVGNIFNGDNWVVAPASTAQRDGLGPVYNATSCSACHSRDGRGRPPEPGEAMLSMLIRLSVPGSDEHGGPLPEPRYGGQLQPQGIPGVPGEGTPEISWEEESGEYADGTRYSLRRPSVTITDLSFGPMQDDVMFSPRVAPPQYGLGLLEAVPGDAILSRADPDDLDGDGISGRTNHVWDAVNQTMALGRFGWKANVPSIRHQTAGALNGDIGITSSVFPDENCVEGQSACAEAEDGGAPEIDEDILDAIVFYGQTLAVPARRDYREPEVLRGRAQFRALGCASCHVPSLTTGEHEIEALSGQRIWPYTDLLLHDMGDDLADGRPDFEASGNEWRTPPLWGIGLLETVNGHQYLLHDGRARGFAEAILWHGGEAEASRAAFVALSKDDREALLAFLASL